MWTGLRGFQKIHLFASNWPTIGLCRFILQRNGIFDCFASSLMACNVFIFPDIWVHSVRKESLLCIESNKKIALLSASENLCQLSYITWSRRGKPRRGKTWNFAKRRTKNITEITVCKVIRSSLSDLTILQSGALLE